MNIQKIILGLVLSVAVMAGNLIVAEGAPSSKQSHKRDGQKEHGWSWHRGGKHQGREGQPGNRWHGKGGPGMDGHRRGHGHDGHRGQGFGPRHDGPGSGQDRKFGPERRGPGHDGPGRHEGPRFEGHGRFNHGPRDHDEHRPRTDESTQTMIDSVVQTA